MKAVMKEEGPTGFFRGLTSTWAREAPGYFFFFAGYDFSRKLLTPSSHKPGDDLGMALASSVFAPSTCKHGCHVGCTGVMLGVQVSRWVYRCHVGCTGVMLGVQVSCWVYRCHVGCTGVMFVGCTGVMLVYRCHVGCTGVMLGVRGDTSHLMYRLLEDVYCWWCSRLLFLDSHFSH